MKAKLIRMMEGVIEAEGTPEELARLFKELSTFQVGLLGILAPQASQGWDGVQGLDQAKGLTQR